MTKEKTNNSKHIEEVIKRGEEKRKELLADITNRGTEKIKELLKVDDVRVENKYFFKTSLYVDDIEVAYCFNSDIINDEKVSYKITEPKKTAITFEFENGDIKPNKYYKEDSINKNIALNIRHQEVVKYIMENNIAKEMFQILEITLTEHQLFCQNYYE